DRAVEHAAVSLGAGPFTMFCRVTLPLIVPGVVSGWVLAFITSFDEVTMTVFIASPSTTTLPVRMFLYIQDNIDPLVTSVSAALSLRSSNASAALASALKDETGIDVAHQRPGGLMLSLSDGEQERRVAQMRRLHNQPEMIPYPYEVLDHARTKALLPEIGSQ